MLNKSYKYNSLIFIIGLISTLPSKYFYLLTIFLCIFFASNLLVSSLPRVALSYFLYVLLFCISLIFGLYLQNNEANNFLLRAIISLFTVVLLSWLASRRNSDFDILLYGIYVGALVNSIFVIVFSFYPELYDSLSISNFSGYDKGNRFLRSPGIQTGTDTSGFLSVIGFVLFIYLRFRNLIKLPFIFFALPLILTPILSSRTSIFLSISILFLFFIRGKRFLTRFELMLSGFIILLFTYIFVFFLAIFYFPELREAFRVEEFLGFNIDLLYAISSVEDYEESFSYFDLVSVMPVGNASDFDNFLGKILASSGIIASIILSLIMISIVWSANLKSAREKIPFEFYACFGFVYFIANLKNTYSFYPLFLVIFFGMAFFLRKRVISTVVIK